jgi:hypothetical protein
MTPTASKSRAVGIDASLVHPLGSSAYGTLAVAAVVEATTLTVCDACAGPYVALAAKTFNAAIVYNPGTSAVSVVVAVTVWLYPAVPVTVIAAAAAPGSPLTVSCRLPVGLGSVELEQPVSRTAAAASKRMAARGIHGWGMSRSSEE